MGSVYGVRDRSVFRHEPTDPEFCRNPHILKWWTEDHDQLIVGLIERDQWIWDWAVTDEVLSITPEHAIDQWKSEDPKVDRWWESEDPATDQQAPEEEPEREKYAWYNIIMYFAKSRAETLGLTDAIRTPEWKICPLCKQPFVEDSLWVPPALLLGIDNIIYCSPCLVEAVHGAGEPGMPRSEILGYVQDLTAVLKRPPTQRHGYPRSFPTVQQIEDLGERIEYLKVLARKPTLERVKGLFGTWQNALIEAGVKRKAR